MNLFVSNSTVSLDPPSNQKEYKEAIPLEGLINEIRDIMFPTSDLKIAHELPSEEIEKKVASFIISIKKGLIDFNDFFPPEKKEQGQLLLQEFAKKYEADRAESKKNLDEMRKELAELERENAEDEKKIKKHQKNIEEHRIKIAEADKKIAEGRKEIEEGRKEIEEGRALIAEAERMTKMALGMYFHNIFNKEKLTEEQAEAFFHSDLAAHLADGSLAIEKGSDGIKFFRINSMKPVIDYLATHPNVKALDFRGFKAEINDISTLTNYLQTAAASSIKGVAFKNFVSDAIKNSMTEVVEARKTTASPLKVQYFA